MADFSHLRAFEVGDDRRSDFTMHGLDVGGRTPTLTLAYAGESNRSYFNALLKNGAKYARLVQAGKISTEALEENREHDRNLYPLHVVKGWRDVVDAKGSNVEFSQEACTEFLHAIPREFFDELRNYASNHMNFVGQADTVDGGELADEEVEDFAEN